MSAVDFWDSGNNATPDYYHTCGWYGIPPSFVPPQSVPDGQGFVGFFAANAQIAELIQICLPNQLDPTKDYVFSSYVGYNSNNGMPPNSSFTLGIWGVDIGCVTPTYNTSTCPPSPLTELLGEITYNLPATEGWVFGQSLCFSPTRAHDVIIIGASCNIQDPNYIYVDKVGLYPCKELLEINFLTYPACPGILSGAIDLSVSGGTPPYTFDWDTDGIGDNDDPEDLFQLDSGNYQIIAMDSDGNSGCLNIYVPVSDPISTYFLPLPAYCQGSPSIPLPKMSENSPPVIGTWTPDSINTVNPGLFQHIFRPDSNICADSVIQYFEVIRTSQDTNFLTYKGCQGDGFQQVINGTRYDESNPFGIENFSLPDVCDSMIQIDFQFNPSTTAIYADTSCTGSGLNIEINSILFDENNPSGTVIISNANDCDSSIQVSLEFLNNYNTVVSERYCEGSGAQLIVNGTVYNESNPIGQETLNAVNGCDSSINIFLIFESPPIFNLEYFGCKGDGFSLTINNTQYDELNPIGTEIFDKAQGCDSTVNVDLTFDDMILKTENYNGCVGDGYSITINNTIYNETNPVGTEILLSSGGCDSVITVDLEFNNEINRTEDYSGCIGDGYSVTINNVVYDETNPTGIERLTSSGGCDSVITVDLVFSNEINTTEDYSGCVGDGYSVTVNNIVYDETNPSGVERLTSSGGCDSVITVDLIFNNEINTTEDYSGCIGDGYSVTVNNVVYDETNPSGVERLTSSGGCDSVITVDLVFNNGINTREDYSGCVGDGYAVTVNNVVYNESNPSGVERLTSSGGCDSVITVDLVFNNGINTREDYSGCIGDGYAVTVNNVVYNESNPSGVERLTSSGGCDSVITVDLVFNDEINTTENYLGCVGDGYSVTVNSVIYDETNPVGVERITSSGGCDSVITVDLEFNNEINTTEEYSGCLSDGYSVTVNNVAYNESNPSGIERLTSSGGCDSVITVDLVFNNEINTTEIYLGCVGDGYSVTVNNTVYNESNPTGMETFASSGSCDSIVTIKLEYLPAIDVMVTYKGCSSDGYSIQINGVEYNEQNPIGVELISGGVDCDTTVIIDLMFYNIIDFEKNITLDANQEYQIDVLDLFNDIDSIIFVDIFGSRFVSCDDCLLPIFSAAENQQIIISVFDQFNCMHTASINFIIESTNAVFIPSVFSPNNDGINDVFQLYTSDQANISIASMAIFNRWGGRVYSITGDLSTTEVSWDGNQNGRLASEGVYIYQVIFVDGQQRTGEVTLVR